MLLGLLERTSFSYEAQEISNLTYEMLQNVITLGLLKSIHKK
jgi:hypothetical protein